MEWADVQHEGGLEAPGGIGDDSKPGLQSRGPIGERCGKENAQDLLTLLAGIGKSSRGRSPGQPNKEEDGRPRSPSEWWDTDILSRGWPGERAPGHGNSPSKSQREVLIQAGWRGEMGGQQRRSL